MWHPLKQIPVAGVRRHLRVWFFFFTIIRLIETSNISHIFIFQGAALPLMPYHFLTFLKPAKNERSVLESHWHIHHVEGGSHCELSLVRGMRRGRGLCGNDIALSLTGSGGERWEGPSRHYKETELGPQASCRALSYRSNVQRCLCLLRRGRKSTQTEAGRPTVAFEPARVSSLSFITWALNSVIH